LDFGAKGDGIADDTESLARAHATGKPVHYPRTSAYYQISHVLPVSASVSSNGAEIRIAGDGTGGKTIFQVKENRKPLAISGLVLDGGYGGGVNGEFSMGVSLYGARDVTIAGNTIRNMYGDCIYLGSSNRSVCANVRIRANKLINPRRCNVAVVCGEDVVIEDNACTKEVDYVFSIDMEPDPNGFDFVRRVRIANNSFTAKKFISAGVNNGVENRGLSIVGNSGSAVEFFHGWENALLRDVTITGNRFSATAANGFMLNLEAVKVGVVTDNIDATACEAGYRSINIRECDITLMRNKFCT
jgi:parallel beta-helix repeat protein